MKSVDKKKGSEPVNSLPLNLLILTLREIVQFFVLNFNYFLRRTNRFREMFNLINVYGEPNWRANHPII